MLLAVPYFFLMTQNQVYSIFKIQDLNDLPNAVSEVLNLENRNVIYDELLKLNQYDLSKDWFQDVFEDELAQRNQNKQDFTPNVVGVLLSRLTGVSEGKTYEPTAGNGSLLIANWWFLKNNIEKFNIENHPVECWELSARSIPILLLNLSIRGMVGDVFFGNVLTKEIKQHYSLTRNIDSQYSEIQKK